MNDELPPPKTENIMGVFTLDQAHRLEKILMPATHEEICMVFGSLTLQQYKDVRAGDINSSAKLMAKLSPSLATIVEKYQYVIRVRSEAGDLEIHRKRLGQIEATARKLSRLLKNEVLMVELEWGEEAKGMWPEFRDSYDRHEDFQDVMLGDLEKIATNAGKLVDDRAWLKAARYDRPENGRQKDLERIWLWEPIFARWKTAGRHVPMSRGGAMWQFLSVVHEALGIDPPGVEAVYSAAVAFNRGVRTPSAPGSNIPG